MGRKRTEKVKKNVRKKMGEKILWSSVYLIEPS